MLSEASLIIEGGGRVPTQPNAPKTCRLMNETILSCSESTTIYDLGTGNSVASLKIPPSSPHCATIIQTKNGQGGLIFSSPVDKSLLYVYSFQKVSMVSTN